MKQNRVLTAATILFFSANGAFGEQSLKMDEHGTEIASPYVAADAPGIVLFSDLSYYRKKRAYLVIDNNGRPALYPSPRRNEATQKRNELGTLNLEELKTLWGIDPIEPDVYTAQFEGWNGEENRWDRFTVSLRFSNNRCVAFKVANPRVLNQWLSVDKIPSARLSSKASIPLPVEIGCVEGPRMQTNCGWSTAEP